MPVITRKSDNLLVKRTLPSELTTPSISYLQSQINNLKIETNPVLTSNYTESDVEKGNKFYAADCSSNSITLTITTNKDRIIVVKKIDNSNNTVTIQPSSGTIDGQTSLSISTQYGSYMLICDGTNWYII